jgi:predicted Zn-dependent protease
MTAYRNILATAGDPGLIWRRMIKVQQDAKAGAQALALCQDAVQACPDDPGLKLQLGEMLQQRGQTQDALELVEAAIALRPDWWLPHVRRGTYLSALGRWRDAIAALRHARSLNPDDHWGLVRLGIALIRDGQAGEGDASIRMALERSPPAARAAIHHQLAQTLSAIGKLSLSLEHHLLAVSSENRQPHMVLGYARLLMRMGQRTRAREVLQSSIENGTDSSAIQHLLEQIRSTDQQTKGSESDSSLPPH